MKKINTIVCGVLLGLWAAGAQAQEYTVKKINYLGQETHISFHVRGAYDATCKLVDEKCELTLQYDFSGKNIQNVTLHVEQESEIQVTQSAMDKYWYGETKEVVTYTFPKGVTPLTMQKTKPNMVQTQLNRAKHLPRELGDVPGRGWLNNPNSGTDVHGPGWLGTGEYPSIRKLEKQIKKDN